MRELRRPIFTIGVAGSLVGVSVSRIRRWERAGIITPARTRSGWRMFSWEDIQMLRRARQLARTRMPLDQLRREVRRRPAPRRGETVAAALAGPVRLLRAWERAALPITLSSR